VNDTKRNQLPQNYARLQLHFLVILDIEQDKNGVLCVPSFSLQMRFYVPVVQLVSDLNLERKDTRHNDD